MYKGLLVIAGTALAVVVGPLNAQSMQRAATITGGGNSDRGKCTVEVVVDGAAEIDIRGTNATLRNLSGQTPQFRRFECTSVMPPNPVNFRFSGVDGRGRQELVRDPANGGTAVVRIEDPDGGAEAYTFDITWNSAGRYPGGQYQQDPYPTGGNQYPPNNDRYPATGNPYPGNGDRYPANRERNRPADQMDENGPPSDARDRYDDRGRYNDRNRYDRDRDSDRDRAMNPQFDPDQAVRVCQDAVRTEAYQRFHARDLSFGRTDMGDNSDRGDAVVGTFEVSRGYRQVQTYRFSCSLDMDTGRVRSTRISPVEGGWR